MTEYRAALAGAFGNFGLAIGAYALAYAVMNPAVDDLITGIRNQTSLAQVTTMLDWLQAAWDWSPLWVAVLLGVYLIARATRETPPSTI